MLIQYMVSVLEPRFESRACSCEPRAAVRLCLQSMLEKQCLILQVVLTPPAHT